MPAPAEAHTPTGARADRARAERALAEWGTQRYLAWLYSTYPLRGFLETVFDLEAEISTSLRGDIEHSVAHIRLQWWRDELNRLVAGQAAHPLSRALAAMLPGPADRLALRGLVDVCVWDLANATFETRRELRAYCERWSAALVGPAASMAGAGTCAAKLVQAGAALRELEWMIRFDAESRRGRLRAPLDELDRLGVAPDDAGRCPWPAPLAGWLAERHGVLRADMTRLTRECAPEEQKKVRGLMVWMALVRGRSVRAQKCLPGPWSDRRLDGIRDGWLAWRTARRADGGRISQEAQR